ncbi:hypothetical protein ECZU34_39000 [Escherichia coli]|nr:hypothetical protein ECZU34_39000 [Escherichia coli]
MQNQRMGALVHTADNYPLLLTVAFLCSAVLAMFGYFLVRKYAPEAGGSGIPEIEGALEDQRPVRWWRVLPVKFFGGLGTLGGGMVLGREGPTVQIGGNIGRMVLDIFRLKVMKRAIRCWQPVLRRGWLRPLTPRWRVFCLLSKRCVRSFAIR